MAGESPVVLIYDTAGNPVAVVDGLPILASQPALEVAGTDGAVARIIRVDTSGRSVVVGAGTAGAPVGGVLSVQGLVGGTPLPVTGSLSGTVTANQGTPNTDPNSWPVHQVGSPPLAVGAATEATLLLANANLTAINADIDVALSTRASEGTLLTRLSKSDFEARINTLGQKAMAASTPVVIASDQSAISVTGPLTDAQLRATPVPVSGTVTANIGTTGGLALDATLTGGAQTSRVTDGTNTATVKAASTAAVATDTAVVVAISPNNPIVANNSSVSATGAAPPASATFIGGSVTTAAPAYTTGQLDALSLNTAGGLRVDGSGVTQPVSGTVTANIGTTAGLALDATLTGGTAKSIVRGGAKGTTTAADVTSTNQSADRQALDVQIRTSAGVAIDTFGGGQQYADGAARGTATGTLAMGDDGTNIQSISVDTTGKLNINNISGTISLPTGAATAALQTQPGVDIGDVTVNNAAGAAAVNIQDGGNSITVDGTVAISGSVAVTGPLTDAQLRATPVPISGTVTANLGTIAGVATEATLTGVLTTTAFQARINTLGQKTMANSTPVVLSSDQTVIPVSDNGGSLTIDTTQLPAALVGGRLDTNIGAWLGSTAPTVGSKTSANSVPVVIASDQGAVAVSGTVTANQGGAPWSQNLTQVAGSAVTTIAAGELRVGVEGLAADGAAPVGNPVLSAGFDGTNTQTLLTDTSGRQRVVGAAAQAAAVVGDPVLIAGEDASGNVQRIRTAALPPVGTTPGVVVRPIAAQTGTVTSVASSATNVTLLAANTSRLAARITNDGNKKMYVKCAATASTTSFTKLLGAGEDWLVDAGYTGIIDGIWDAANGSARITEYS